MGKRVDFEPIKDINTLFEDLDKRKAGGFGGVTEYGITVRWNKNYLTLIRLLLERRNHFRLYDGVRFGSSINTQIAKQIGIDHVALCMGAGSPNLPNIPNIMAKGVKTASDFLMSLQLTGAARKESIANLQVKLPIVVIGGGLTAIDTATESLAYYPVQVEKLLNRFELLGDRIFNNLSDLEKEDLNLMLEHARQLRQSPEQKNSTFTAMGRRDNCLP